LAAAGSVSSKGAERRISDAGLGASEKGGLTGVKGHGDDVEDDDLDALLGQQLDDAAADAAGAAGDQDDLLAPDIAVGLPVVERAAIEVAVDPAHEAEGEKDLDAAEGLFV